MKTYKSPMPEISIKYKSGEFRKTKITSSIDSAMLFSELFNSDTIEYTEEVFVLFLNTANNTIGYTKHSSGGMAQAIVDPKVILTQSLLCGANSIIVAHNHPSGQLSPSSEDKNITKKLKSACDILGIRLLDHIIISPEIEINPNAYYSFADDGAL